MGYRGAPLWNACSRVSVERQIEGKNVGKNMTGRLAACALGIAPSAIPSAHAASRPVMFLPTFLPSICRSTLTREQAFQSGAPRYPIALPHRRGYRRVRGPVIVFRRALG